MRIEPGDKAAGNSQGGEDFGGLSLVEEEVEEEEENEQGGMISLKPPEA